MKHDSGNALVLSMLILLTLTSVGVVSVQRTAMNLAVVGNVSRAVQANTTGDAGMIHGLVRVGNNPGKFARSIAQQRIEAFSAFSTSAGSEKQSRDVAEFSTAMDAETERICYTEPSNCSNELRSLARLSQQVAYTVEAVWIPPQQQGMPGWSVDATICHQVFDYTARGGIPTAVGESVEDTMSQRDTVVVQNRARGISGPVLCQ